MNATWSGSGHEHDHSITRDDGKRLITWRAPPSRDRTCPRLGADRGGDVAAGADLPERRAERQQIMTAPAEPAPPCPR
jgi:hypothetical protein